LCHHAYKREKNKQTIFQVFLCASDSELSFLLVLSWPADSSEVLELLLTGWRVLLSLCTSTMNRSIVL